MAFLPNDHYLTSGSSQLINTYVDPVYKFDSSSFYNWEQDNLPVYDLEDRDNLLYEMAGYPTSSVVGVSLCVSNCGVDNKKVFGTLDDAIEALPNTIRFPIIIEVAASGQLGELRLEDKEFEGSSAGLEIINRGFAKALCGSAALDYTSRVSQVDGGTAGSSITTFISPELSSTMYESSAICVSSTVWQNPGPEDYWDQFVRAFVLTPEWSRNGGTSPRTISISTSVKDTKAVNFSSAAEAYSVGDENYGTANGYGDNSTATDIVPSNNTNDTAFTRANIWTAAVTDSRATGLVYANALSGVTIKNCVGRVYVRGFCVDGGDQANFETGSPYQRTSKGFDIENSEVVIENCTAMRCIDAGLQAVNSNVTLNRGFIAFRNYQLSTTPGSSDPLDGKILTNPTPGLRAINSHITLSAADSSGVALPIDSPYCFYRNMVGIELENSVLETPEAFKFGTNIAGVEKASNNGSQVLTLQTFYNVKEGIKALNSEIKTSQRVASFCNNIGVALDNSIFKVGQFTFDHNNTAGLLTNNSLFNYNKDAISTGITGGPLHPVYRFKSNGQDVVLNNSKFVPTYVSGMDAVYETMLFSGNHLAKERLAEPGVSKVKTTLPSVVVDNGSYMDVMAPLSISPTFEESNDTTKYKVNDAIKGAAFRVIKDSTLRLVGNTNYASWILGPYMPDLNSDVQQKVAGIYAGDSSKVEFAGPTSIMQFGVDVLAENNSTAEFGPPKIDGIINVSGFNLGNAGNQTKVQLHATRACLVANNKSTLDMHDMGDYHGTWRPSFYESVAVDYPTGATTAAIGPRLGYNTSGYCSAGSFQFYPNPFAPYITGPATTAGSLGCHHMARYPQSIWTGGSLTTYDDLTGNNAVGMRKASHGGMCIRATQGSKVHAKNVNYLAGWYNASGAYYDASGPALGCDSLRIWNIADDSELYASYLSVSSCHPQDTSSMYWGPSAMWASSTGTAAADYVAISGAPSSTPDTSTISVLDTFGGGWNTGAEFGWYGKTAQQNFGAFRIYISPTPETKFLGYVKNSVGDFYIPNSGRALGTDGPYYSMGFNFDDRATLVAGPPYQIIAQGYSPSGDCSATNGAKQDNWTNVSAIYQPLGFSAYVTALPTFNTTPNPQTTNVASSFFYPKDMIAGDPANRIWLDESAMNTFANAKNGTLGTSNRKKIFSYYRTTTTYPGEGFWEADAGFGKGLGSANLFDLDREL